MSRSRALSLKLLGLFALCAAMVGASAPSAADLDLVQEIELPGTAESRQRTAPAPACSLPSLRTLFVAAPARAGRSARVLVYRAS